jgi:hypothetical protein
MSKLSDNKKVLQSKLGDMCGVVIDTTHVDVSLTSLCRNTQGLFDVLNLIKDLISSGILEDGYDMWHDLGYYNSIDDCKMQFMIAGWHRG